MLEANKFEIVNGGAGNKLKKCIEGSDDQLAPQDELSM